MLVAFPARLLSGCFGIESDGFRIASHPIFGARHGLVSVVRQIDFHLDTQRGPTQRPQCPRSAATVGAPLGGLAGVSTACPVLTYIRLAAGHMTARYPLSE